MRALLAASLLLLAPVVGAGEIPPAAQLHFKLADQAYAVGDYKTAIEEYKRTYEIYANPVVLYSIAQVCRETKDYQCAQHFYRQYIERAPANSKYLATANEKIAEVEKAIAASVSPPTGPIKPEQETVSPTITRVAPRAGAAPSTVQLVPSTQSTTAPSDVHRSRTWLWVTLVVVAAVVAIGVTIGLAVGSSSHNSPPDSTLGTYGVLQ